MLLPRVWFLSSWCVTLRNMAYGDEFGSNVKLLREARGWTRADVVRELDAYGVQMYPMTLKRIEDGTQQAKISEALVLAELFDRSVEALSGAGVPPELQEVKRRYEATYDRGFLAAELWARWETEAHWYRKSVYELHNNKEISPELLEELSEEIESWEDVTGPAFVLGRAEVLTEGWNYTPGGRSDKARISEEWSKVTQHWTKVLREEARNGER